MPDQSNPNIIEFQDVVLNAAAEVEAFLSNKNLKPFQRKRLQALRNQLQRLLAQAEVPGPGMEPERMAIAYDGIADEVTDIAAKAGFDVRDFAAINEDALELLTGQPRNPGTATAMETIIGRTEPGPLRDLQIKVAAEVLATGGGQKDFEERLLAEIEAQGLELPPNYADRPQGYAEMVSRTLYKEIHDARARQRADAAGLDLMQLNEYGALDPCRYVEGVIASRTGKTRGYPTVADIESSNTIGHPNCGHRWFPVVPELLDDDEVRSARGRAREVNNFLSLPDEDRKKLLKQAIKEDREAHEDSWDSEATEAGV